MTTPVHEAEKLSLKRIEAFLNASKEIRFEGETQPRICHWFKHVLGRQEYHQQSRQARGHAGFSHFAERQAFHSVEDSSRHPELDLRDPDTPPRGSLMVTSTLSSTSALRSLVCDRVAR